MATYDIVVLSSSPACSAGDAQPYREPPRPHQHVPMSPLSPAASPRLGSSSNRPSGALKSSSRAARVPEDVASGFPTARSLVTSAHFALDHDPRRTAANKRRPRSESVQNLENTVSELRAPDGAIPDSLVAAATAGAKLKKPRARKAVAQADQDGPAALDSHDSAQAHLSADPKSRRRIAKQGARRAKEAEAQPPVVSEDNSKVIQPEPAPLKPTRTRKPRAKKANSSGNVQDGDSSALVEKTNIPETKARPKAKSSRKGTGAVSKHFGRADHAPAANGAENDDIWDIPPTPPCKTILPRKRQSSAVPDKTELEEAVPRRRDWTPVKDTHVKGLATGSPGNVAAAFTESAAGAAGITTSMFSASAFADVSSTTLPPSISEKMSRAKRQKVDLVSVPGQRVMPQEKPEKPKAVKKKARTITDMVTDQYNLDVPANPPDQGAASIFVSRTTTTQVHLKESAISDTKTADAKPKRKRSASKTSTKAVSKSEKTSAKPKLMANKLLSPASAMHKLSRQDILFGTSSQLAPEESPTTLRQIQQAIRESERDAHLFSDELLTFSSPPRALVIPQLEKIKGRRQLWKASSRDEDGQLLQHQNLYIPEPDRTQDIPLLVSSPGEHASSFADIDDFEPPPIIPQAGTSRNNLSPNPTSPDGFDDIDLPPPSNQQADSQIRLPQSSVEDIDAFGPAPPSNQEVSTSFLDIDDILPPAQAPNMPKTGASLPVVPPKKAVRSSSSRTTKPAKKPSTSSPKKPGSCLVKSVSQSLPPSTPPKSQSRFTNIEEILDSEDDEALSPTPPRKARLQASPPLKLVSTNSLGKAAMKNDAAASATEPVAVFRASVSQLTWEGMKPRIFDLITTHIRSMPPSTDPNQPTWHEKMLMYDPIILEDLTAYLNANTSIRVYKRATQKQIKDWNKKAKADGRDILTTASEDEFLCVEKELEVYMAQAWCQQYSICCVLQEGRGRGSVRKGLY